MSIKHSKTTLRSLLSTVFAAAMLDGAFAAQAETPAPHIVASALPSEKPIGAIEPVFEFYAAMPTGVTVSSKGRIFVNFPRWGDDVPFTVGEIRAGKVVAYPDAATNIFDPARPDQTLDSVQSVVIDPLDRLWILDTGSPNFMPPAARAAKLVAVDLATDKVVTSIVLPEAIVTPNTYLNDVRFDLRKGKSGVAFITDSSAGGLIVVDLATGEAWRKLLGHPSTSPDPTFIAIVEGEQLAIRPKDKPQIPFAFSADGIALSDDGATVYYSPLSSRHLYAVPTALLRDRSAAEDVVGRAVVDLGEKGASDGLSADHKGRIYASDYENNSIRQRQADGQWTTVAHDPRILWPDTLWVAQDGYLYFTANQLHRQGLFHEGRDLRRKPYTLFRLKIDAGPASLN